MVEDVRQWQGRPPDAVYPIVYLDCIHVKVRDSGTVSTKAVYLALRGTMNGVKELLGMWISPNEGAKFWLSVVTELQNRGVQDIFIACVDGLKGFPEAIESVFPKTQIQLCIVHLVRHSLKYVGWKERKAVAADYACAQIRHAHHQSHKFCPYRYLFPYNKAQQTVSQCASLIYYMKAAYRELSADALTENRRSNIRK